MESLDRPRCILLQRLERLEAQSRRLLELPPLGLHSAQLGAQLLEVLAQLGALIRRALLFAPLRLACFGQLLGEALLLFALLREGRPVALRHLPLLS